MTAVITRVVRYGAYAVTSADGELRQGGDEPTIYAHVYRRRLHIEWEITAGRTGEVLAFGRTWTRGGAMVSATRAAHTPGILSQGGAR